MVAVKSLRQDKEDKTDRYSKEFEVLDVIRKIDHPHLIKAIASYTRGAERCFIFPWAEGGNLREFWKTHSLDTRDHELITWIIEQLRGVFEGLRTLHYWNKKQNCRHGDLKPENILLFLKAGGKRIPGRGNLVVADLGLTKFHSEATKLRNQPTGTWTGTQKYEPPETDTERGETGQPRSRLYDMWSMGCIVLECIVWLLYGFNELERFNKKLEKFWHIRNGKHQVHATAETWMDFIARDPRCKEGTAVRDLLDLVRHRLLVVDTKTLDPSQNECEERKYRAYSKESEKLLDEIVEKATPEYLCETEVWEKTKNASGPRETSWQMASGHLSVSQPAQAALPSIPQPNFGSEGSDIRDIPLFQIENTDARDFGSEAEEHGNMDTGEVSSISLPTTPDQQLTVFLCQYVSA
jgi:serine/threonine protein kinase